MDESFKRVIKSTGKKPSECRCRVCQDFCKTPCLGTPQDIKRLMDNGYIDSLSIVAWMLPLELDVLPIPVPMVQIVRDTEECVFYLNGGCLLHYSGLKPTEGKLYNHKIIPSDKLRLDKSLTWNIGMEWVHPDNIRLVSEVLARFALNMIHEHYN